MKETPYIIGDLRQCTGPLSVRPPPWVVMKEMPDIIGDLKQRMGPVSVRPPT